MAEKCYTCGIIYDGWSCPVCSAKEEIEQQKKELEESTKEQQHAREESVREQERMLESQKEEMESALEESQREMEYALEDAAERQKQIAAEAVAKQRKITSEAWKLQAESKIEKANGLLKAGLSDEAIKLLSEAISQDPSNLLGYCLVSDAFQKIGHMQEAKNYLSKATLLLKTEEYQKNLLAHFLVLNTLALLNTPEILVQNFKNIFNANIEMWNFADKDGVVDSSVFASAIELCIVLTALNSLEETSKLSERLTKRVINYGVFEVTTLKASGHSWKEDRSIEKKVVLLSMLVHPDLKWASEKKDKLILLMGKSGLLNGALKISKHLIKLIGDKAQEKGNDFKEYAYLINTLMYFIEVNNRLGMKDTDDLIAKSLRIIPYHQRSSELSRKIPLSNKLPGSVSGNGIFEQFKINKDSGKFSDVTVNLMREKILKRYKEWESEIESDFRERAREWGKRRAEDKKTPAVVGWIAGIGSFPIMAVIFGGIFHSSNPGSSFFVLFACIAIGIFTKWQITQNIISKFESEEILEMEEKEKEALETIRQ